MDRDLINRFAAGADKPRLGIAGLTRADCTARPGPGEWSIQELVVHLADSDAVAINRMKWVIAEESPALVAMDENRWAKNLFADEQSLEDAALLFEFNRRQMVRIMNKLPAPAMDRAGMHSERGRVTLRDLIVTYTDHLEHHMTFLHAKRERLGKPLG